VNGLPYYKAYPRDFLDGTAGMDFEVKGAYRILLDLIYLHGGRLVDEPRFIAGHLGCSVKKWNALRQAVLSTGKIVVSGGYLGNLRADKELDSLKSFQTKQRENGLQPKKNKHIAEATAEPKANHTESDTDTYGGGGSAREALSTDREAILTAIGVDPVSGITGPAARMIGTQADMAEVARWLELPGLTMPLILGEIRQVMANKRDGPPSSFRFFTKAMQRLSAELSRPALDPIHPTTGARNDRQRFDQTIHAIADGLSAGTVDLGLEDRDPFRRNGTDD
jgi:uncharacterized protein YdaU (DUF1376 family)